MKRILPKIIIKKYELVSNLSERCFLIHILLYKVISLFEVPFYIGILVWFIMACLTILNEKFHLWVTEKLFVFLFKTLPFNYHLYNFCVQWREILQRKTMSNYVASLSFVVGATIVMFIVDPSSFDYTKFTWYTMIFVLLLGKYFRLILVPIFHSARDTRTEKLHIEAGKQQLRQFHSSRSLYMPFGKAGHEFAKGMKKFAFANPKLTVGALLIGGAIPGTQHVYNKQRTADFEQKVAATKEAERAIRDAHREKCNQIEHFHDFIQEKCTLANAKLSPVCEKYKEAIDLTFDAWKASNGL